MLYTFTLLQYKERYACVLSEEKQLKNKIRLYLFWILSEYIYLLIDLF